MKLITNILFDAIVLIIILIFFATFIIPLLIQGSKSYYNDLYKKISEVCDPHKEYTSDFFILDLRQADIEFKKTGSIYEVTIYACNAYVLNDQGKRDMQNCKEYKKIKCPVSDLEITAPPQYCIAAGTSSQCEITCYEVESINPLIIQSKYCDPNDFKDDFLFGNFCYLFDCYYSQKEQRIVYLLDVRIEKELGKLKIIVNRHI